MVLTSFCDDPTLASHVKEKVHCFAMNTACFQQLSKKKRTKGEMKFFVEDVKVVFPYDYIYPEQLEYMTELKRGLDKRGHIVLEMPSGTGKTISLLSLLVGYVQHASTTGGNTKIKIVYCTRTIVEMTKTMEELRRLVERWEMEGEPLKPLLGICLSARKNMCVEERVATLTYQQEVDAACRSATAPWVRSEGRCPFYDRSSQDSRDHVALPVGIYTLDDLRKFGREQCVCPYYLVKQALDQADIIVHSYLYLVDPAVSPSVTEHLTGETIVVMDEGHNVDDVCIEAMSLIVTREDAQAARGSNLRDLTAEVENVKVTNRQRLQDEYDRLVNGLASADANAAQRLPRDIADEAIPGNLRQASSFLTFMSRIANHFCKVIARLTNPEVADPISFLGRLRDDCAVDIRHLRFTSERLRILLNTLQISDNFKYRHLSLIAAFVTNLATHYKGERHERPSFVVIAEPFDPQNPSVPDPLLRLCCVDASLAVKDVFEKYRSVVLTSGTLSPLGIYPKILGFTPVVSRSLPMTLSRKCVCPIIVTRSADQVSLVEEDLTSSYTVRVDAHAQEAVCSAYSKLLLDLAQSVPDGIVCFFTGYHYMADVLLRWNSSGFLNELAAYKLIFIETQGVQETSIALANYRRACDMGRGAIFLSIARGKIAEGIDFDRHYGRAVVVFGVPFLPPTERSVVERMKWLEACLSIPESEFRNFDAMRHACQCVGRVIRNKADYGLMIFVDRRFALSDKKRKMPLWIQQNLKQNTNLSTEAAVAVARSFFKSMAQPWNRDKDLGSTLLDYTTMQQRGLTVPQPTQQLAPSAGGAPTSTAASGIAQPPNESPAPSHDRVESPIAAVEEPTGENLATNKTKKRPRSPTPR